MRGAGFTLEEGRTGLNISQKLLPVRALRTWHRLPREVVMTHPWKYSSPHLRGFEELGLVENVPPNGKRLEIDDL